MTKASGSTNVTPRTRSCANSTGGYCNSVAPPYVNAFCTSEASCATNWKAAPATNTEQKIAPPLTTITGISSSFGPVQSMSSVVSAYPSTSAPWVTRPRRRRAKRSAATCASTGAGRTSSVSSVPSRTRRPNRSIDPISRSASPKARLDRPYRKAISGREKPPSASTLENISRIAMKSRPVTAKLVNVVRTKEAR